MSDGNMGVSKSNVINQPRNAMNKKPTEAEWVEHAEEFAKFYQPRNDMKEQKIWDSEPDRLEFTVHGVMCKIERISGLGHLCGYIMVEDTHPWYAKDYNELSDVDVHGGLTYRGLFPTYSWLGFDCAHAGDLVPKLNHLANDDSGDVYRDMGYVVNELIKLARQANHAEGYGVQAE